MNELTVHFVSVYLIKLIRLYSVIGLFAIGHVNRINFWTSVCMGLGVIDFRLGKVCRVQFLPCLILMRRLASLLGRNLH